MKTESEHTGQYLLYFNVVRCYRRTLMFMPRSIVIGADRIQSVLKSNMIIDSMIIAYTQNRLKYGTDFQGLQIILSTLLSINLDRLLYYSRQGTDMINGTITDNIKICGISLNLWCIIYRCVCGNIGICANQITSLVFVTIIDNL